MEMRRRELLGGLEGGPLRACFSNTNELHWDYQSRNWGVGELFDRLFLSFELDLVKPDAEAFEHVVEALGCAPAEILFIDDNALNVEGARAVGIDAERCVGLDAVEALLRSRGLLPRP